MSVYYEKTWGGPPYSAFRGQFTIVNQGGTALRGWSMRASFPGDSFDWVYNGPPGGGPFDNAWTQDGTLVLNAAASETIPPGGRLTVLIQAQGGTLGPVACSFDGGSC